MAAEDTILFILETRRRVPCIHKETEEIMLHGRWSRGKLSQGRVKEVTGLLLTIRTESISFFESVAVEIRKPRRDHVHDSSLEAFSGKYLIPMVMVN